MCCPSKTICGLVSALLSKVRDSWSRQNLYHDRFKKTQKSVSLKLTGVQELRGKEFVHWGSYCPQLGFKHLRLVL